MKKLLSVIALVGILASCNNKKEDKTETTTGDTTVSTTNNANTDNTTTTTTTTAVETPKFSDPEIQKFVDDYSAFWNDYQANWQNPEKAAEYQKQMTDWSTKSQSIGMKLASNPEDLQKWTDWWTAMAQKMQNMVPNNN